MGCSWGKKPKREQITKEKPNPIKTTTKKAPPPKPNDKNLPQALMSIKRPFRKRLIKLSKMRDFRLPKENVRNFKGAGRGTVQ